MTRHHTPPHDALVAGPRVAVCVSAGFDQAFQRHPTVVPKGPIKTGAERQAQGVGRPLGFGVGLGLSPFWRRREGDAERQDLGVVHSPVTDGVGDCRIAKGFVPNGPAAKR
jgi:hypothetical protein